MISTALNHRLETAVEVASKAAAVALELRSGVQIVPATLKGAHDWLTEADKAVESLISNMLAQAHPEDAFQGEEAGQVRGGSLKWVVDPIDGTSNYMRGSPRFCVSLGLVDGQENLLGVVVAPALHQTFAAVTKMWSYLEWVGNTCCRHARYITSDGRNWMVVAQALF